MKQVLLKKGQAILEEVSSPVVGDNEVFVQVSYSCISTGTEMSGVKNSAIPLYKRVLKQPEKIKKAISMVKEQGLVNAINTVKKKMDIGNPTGYSVSGIVLEVGKNIKDIKKGDRVACAGAGIANHAQFVSVPRNLLVKVPDSLSLDLASTVTLGSIALQGVRRADPKLGEYVAVIGLGLLGQLTVQMLKVNGCKVIGVDIDEKRVKQALSLGMDKGLNPSRDEVIDDIIRFSGGYGVDSVILTASSASNSLINDAMKMCRRKGKVVIVGAVGLNIVRDYFYAKELDVVISTSYGPGRYDDNYELKGQDYPYAYVRWTENRNMDIYLDMMNRGLLDVKPLIYKVYPIEDVTLAYEELNISQEKPLIALLEYSKETIVERKVIVSEKKPQGDKINVAIIGAGNFAKGVHLPNLQRVNNLYNIYAVLSRTGSNAKAVAGQFGASYSTTDINEIINDKDVDMVIISTRHNLHASMAIKSAKAGKAILLEKPMALNSKELNSLVKVLEETKVPFMVGFNRRFSPYAQRIKELIENRTNPMIINYRMNAGFIPGDSWVHTDEGGGRNIGEACHIYDLFNFFTDSEVESVSANSIEPKTSQYFKNDNFVTTIKYKDGSVCNLVYTALGFKSVPKEQMDIYFDGKIISLMDYKALDFYGIKIKSIRADVQQKGQLEELVAFKDSIKKGNGYPIPLWQLIQATKISFEVEKKIFDRS